MAEAATGSVGEGAGRPRRRAPRFTLAIPAWLFFLLFFAIPVMLIVWYSFGYKPVFLPIATDQLSLDRYVESFSATFRDVFSGTLRISITGTILCLLIGFPFAYWLAVKVPSRWRGLLLGLTIVPFWTNFLVRTLGWLILLQPNGALSNVLQDLHLIGGPLDVLDTREAVQLGVVYNYLPLMIFPLFVALDRLDPALREASKDLGANRWKTFRQVTLPLSMPGVVAGLLLVFIPLTGDYITAAVLGGAEGNMVGALVASQFTVAQNWALGSAMAVILILMIFSSVAIFALLGLVARALIRRARQVDLVVEPA